MTNLSRVLFPIVIPIILLLNSCSKENNPLLDECNCEDHYEGKLKSDICYAILKPDHTLWTWGLNLNGQLGNGTTDSSDIPLEVPSIGKIIDFDLYSGMAVAAGCNGDIWFWGSNALSSMMWPEILSPVKCSYLNDIKSIEICSVFIHMLKYDGTVWRIQIGPDVESSLYEPEIFFEQEQIVSISQSIALTKDRTLCELIPGDPEHGGFVPVTGVVAVQNVINRRTVILRGDGTVWAWGQNDFGQLGDGTYEHSAVPVKVKDLNNIIQISANYDFNLALGEDGTVWFWGFICKWDEDHHPIGINIPEKIDNLDNIVLVYAGATCLVMGDDGSYRYFSSEDRIPHQVFY